MPRAKPTLPKNIKTKPLPQPAPRPVKQAFTIRSLTLTPADEKILRRLSQDASDYIGRTVSESAIVRALLRQADQQGPPAADALFLQIEQELQSGVMWGRKK
jgi:hypothetical protein